MTVLASTAYDPAVAVSVSATAATAMTAFDTTNLRLTFTAPSNGNVLIRSKVPFSGTTGVYPQFLIGVLDGATVKVRMMPMCQNGGGGLTVNASNMSGFEGVGLVTGLTPGNSYTWDLAYAIDVAAGASGALKYGGPNDASGADAWGAITYEIWKTDNLLAGIMYDPSTAASKATSLSAMTAFDTVNLRNTFSGPSSGNVFWRIRTLITGASTSPLPAMMLGILESTTVVARQAPCLTAPSSGSSFPSWVCEATGVVTGVSGGSHNWDAAYAIQLAGGSANFKVKYGGPDDTTADNAWGGFLFDLWSA